MIERKENTLEMPSPLMQSRRSAPARPALRACPEDLLAGEPRALQAGLLHSTRHQPRELPIVPV